MGQRGWGGGVGGWGEHLGCTPLRCGATVGLGWIKVIGVDQSGWVWVRSWTDGMGWDSVRRDGRNEWINRGLARVIVNTLLKIDNIYPRLGPYGTVRNRTEPNRRRYPQYLPPGLRLRLLQPHTDMMGAGYVLWWVHVCIF